MDETLLLAINHGWSNPLLDGLFAWLSARWTFSLPLMAVILADAMRRAGRRGLRLWLFLVLALAAGDLIGNVAKTVLAQPRPCYSHYSELLGPGGVPMERCEGGVRKGLPSNHALNFALATTFLFLTTPWRGWHVVLVVVTVLVGLSRIYLGKHLPSQVLLGATMGAGLGLMAGLYACYHRQCLPGAPGLRTAAPP